MATSCRYDIRRSSKSIACRLMFFTITRRPIGPFASKNGLQILHQIFCPGDLSCRPPNLSDIILIAIDFEGINTIRNGFSQKGNSEVGIAILDTKNIGHVSPDNLIATYSFSTGTSSYVAKTSKKFNFGETVAIAPSDMVHRIPTLIPPARNVVFVGHGIRNDILALQALEFQFPTLLSGIIDTYRVANEVFEIWFGSLGELLLKLECPFNRLHCAGNDANFTFKALLLLAVRAHSVCHQDKDEGSKVFEIFQQVSTTPIPAWVDPEVLAMPKRERRRERSRRYQSRMWSMEVQDQIREERRRKRETDRLYATSPQGSLEEL